MMGCQSISARFGGVGRTRTHHKPVRRSDVGGPVRIELRQSPLHLSTWRDVAALQAHHLVRVPVQLRDRAAARPVVQPVHVLGDDVRQAAAPLQKGKAVVNSVGLSAGEHFPAAEGSGPIPLAVHRLFHELRVRHGLVPAAVTACHNEGGGGVRQKLIRSGWGTAFGSWHTIPPICPGIWQREIAKCALTIGVHVTDGTRMVVVSAMRQWQTKKNGCPMLRSRVLGSPGVQGGGRG